MIQLLKYGNTNCYYIKGKNGSMLIDTDWAGTLQAFYRKIKELNITQIDYLLITHYHPDHIGIAQNIIDMGTKLLLIDVQKDYIHCSDKIFEKDKNIDFKPINTEPIIISCEQSREFLNGLGIDGEIIYTPGHSEDSISLINNSWNKILRHNISKIYYGHHEHTISNIKKIEDTISN